MWAGCSRAIGTNTASALRRCARPLDIRYIWWIKGSKGWRLDRTGFEGFTDIKGRHTTTNINIDGIATGRLPSCEIWEQARRWLLATKLLVADLTTRTKRQNESRAGAAAGAALRSRHGVGGGMVGYAAFFFRHYTPAAQGPVLFYVGVSIRHSSLARNLKIICNYLNKSAHMSRQLVTTREAAHVKTLSDTETKLLIFLSIPSCAQLPLSRYGPIISAGPKTTTRKQAKRGDAVPAIHTAAM